MSGRLRILVAGRIGVTPDQGGAAWAVLQYVLGFARLGHRVDFVEVLPAGSDPTRATAAIGEALGSVGLGDRWALGVAGTTGWTGPSAAVARRGPWDVLIDLSGSLGPGALADRCARRCYVDLDPGFTQAWEAQGVGDLGLDGHTHFATVGPSIGSPDCPVPTGGRAWIPLLPPVVLDAWTPADGVTWPAFTTVANWRSYGSAEWGGVTYGQRAHSFRPLAGLPCRSPVALRPALAIDPGETDDLALLDGAGWELLDPARLAATPASYRDFVRGSLGELSVAKSGYVAGRAGWFSDRSACYLAAGRPVVAQDTGFARHLPVGEGLVAFDDLDSAVAGLEAVVADLPRHRAAARAVAAEHLDSDRVLSGLLDAVGAGRG